MKDNKSWFLGDGREKGKKKIDTAGTQTDQKHEKLEKEEIFEYYSKQNYQMKLGPIWEIAVSHPAAHNWGPSTAMANGVRSTRESIDKQA